MGNIKLQVKAAKLPTRRVLPEDLSAATAAMEKAIMPFLKNYDAAKDAARKKLNK
jgi:hypothetical protein